MQTALVNSHRYPPMNDDDDKGQVEMVHTNVPDEHVDHIKKGWNEFYWKPWKAYLKK